MADPFDDLHRPLGSTLPDAGFHAELMERVRRELTRSPDESVTWTRDLPDVSELVTDPPGTPTRPRVLMAAIAAVAAVIGLVLVMSGRDADEPADRPTPTSAPTTSATLASATTAPPSITDAEIADAGLLAADEVGGGYQRSFDGSLAFTLARSGGPGASSPECAPFLDTVFEQPTRPAEVATRPFVSSGALFEQYVVVFPDEAAAISMIESVADPAFAECWAAVTTEAYSATDVAEISARTALRPVPPPDLAPVGDRLVVLRMKGTFRFGGTTFDDDGPTVFVRVGRAVTFVNPNFARSVTGVDGYTADELSAALSAAVVRLRAAQA